MSEIEDCVLVPLVTKKTPSKGPFFKEAKPATEKEHLMKEKTVSKEDWDYTVEWIRKMVKKEAKRHPRLKDILRGDEPIEEFMEKYAIYKKEKRQQRRSWGSEFARVFHNVAKLCKKKYVDESYVEGSSTAIFEEGTARISWRWQKNE
jgi:hypothetical protein